MKPEFAVHELNDLGLTKAADVGEVFSQALENLTRMGVDGRELAIVTTKLQEACFFAKRSIAVKSENNK